MRNWMALAAVVVVITSALQFVWVYRDRFNRSERDVAQMARLFQWHKATYGDVAYDLYSFDGGSTWVAVTPKGIAGNIIEVFGEHAKTVLDGSRKVSYQPKGWWQNHNRIARNEATVAWWESLYDTKIGSGMLTGNYTLVSFDKGRNWVALGKDRQILGDVNKVHPGLLDREKALDILTDLGMKKGPLDLNKPEVQSTLRRAGFEIKSYTAHTAP